MHQTHSQPHYLIIPELSRRKLVKATSIRDGSERRIKMFTTLNNSKQMKNHLRSNRMTNDVNKRAAAAP